MKKSKSSFLWFTALIGAMLGGIAVLWLWQMGVMRMATAQPGSPEPPKFKTRTEREAWLMKTLLPWLEDYGQKHSYWNVPRKDGEFLRLLVEATNRKRCLEIGSANGYSAIWIGLGLEETGGELTTIEIDRRKAKECKENLQKAGLDKIVTSITGDAFEVIPTLKGPFDFVFIDANKGDELKFFKLVYPKLTEGAVIAVHNAIVYRSAMQDYLDAVMKHPEFDTVILSCTMHDGFAVSYRKRRVGGASSPAK